MSPRAPLAWLAWMLAAMALLSPAAGTDIDPEIERLRLVQYYRERFPDVRSEDYVFGALALDPDAKAHYLSVMELPPFAPALAAGERLWLAPFANGRTYADCLPRRGRMIAGDYPRYDNGLGRVITFEDALNDCRTRNGEIPYALTDAATMGLLSAYARSLSDGMRVEVRVEGAGARAAYEDGRRTFHRRLGQLNFSCAQCHVDHAGNRLGAVTLSMAIGQSTHWPVFQDGERPVTLQQRYAECLRRVRHVPEAAGSARMNNLEYYHSHLSNGLEMHASVYRR